MYCLVTCLLSFVSSLALLSLWLHVDSDCSSCYLWKKSLTHTWKTSILCMNDSHVWLFLALHLFVTKIRLKEVMCVGVTAGAYILTLFAVSCQYSAISMFCAFLLIMEFSNFHLADEVQRTSAWVNSCFSHLQSSFVDWMAL